MQTAICVRTSSELLWLYMPRTVYWALGGSSLLLVLYLVTVVAFLIMHQRRPRNRRSDAVAEDMWRRGSLPTLIIGLLVAYANYKSLYYFYNELQHLIAYYNVMCVYPTVSGVLSHTPLTP